MVSPPSKISRAARLLIGLIVGGWLWIARTGFLARPLQRLTYAGHEFLDAARDERLSNKARQTVLSNAGTLTSRV
jgi:hypothetical protein